MKKILKILSELDIYASGILLILMFLDCMLQILTRVAPTTAPKWTVEMGTILMCAMLWIGMGQGVRDEAHIRFTMIVDLFPRKAQKAFLILGDAVFLVFSVILAYYSFRMLEFYAQNHQSTTILGWEKCYTKAPMFIGLVVVVIRLAYGIVRGIVHFNDPADDSAAAETEGR